MSNWDFFYHNISQYVTITDEQFDICKSMSFHKRYRKRQYILQEGEVSKHISFIINGATRTYEVDEQGREHILSFGMDGWWIGHLESFLNESSSTVNIDCLENCEVIHLSKTKREELFRLVQPMETLCRKLVEKATIEHQRRILNKLSKTAGELYADFIERYPKLEQRIPNHQIASYLGITPQSLSRIRSQQDK